MTCFLALTLHLLLWPVLALVCDGTVQSACCSPSDDQVPPLAIVTRVFYAFVVDAGLYSVWQSILLAKAEAKFRYVPFFGMAAYLLTGGGLSSAGKAAKP